MNKEIDMTKPRTKDILKNKVGADKEMLISWYKTLRLGRALDDRAPNYLKQAIGWSYHAPCAGHDAIQLAIGQVFSHQNGDHLFPYYRDLTTCLSAGLSAEEIILNGSCSLYTYPKNNAKKLMDLNPGSSLSILRKWVVNERDIWVRVELVTNLLIEHPNRTTKGWIRI